MMLSPFSSFLTASIAMLNIIRHPVIARSAFSIPLCTPRKSIRPPISGHRSPLTTLHAKKRPSGRGRRSKAEPSPVAKDNASSNPTQRQTPLITPKTKQVILTLSPESLPSLKIRLHQIDDVSWWENPANTNPYGAKLWPSALGIAQFLAQYPKLENRNVLELGCGTGLCSIVAASRGANVLASDVSNVALTLTRKGWKETRASMREDDAGTLEAVSFDLTGSSPLPTVVGVSEGELPRIVIAAAMMYEADLAGALARRVAEAVKDGSWVIIADDDTGNREGGRQLFEKELSRILTADGDRRLWMPITVKYAALGWVEKKVKLLHLNHPEDLPLSL